MNPHSLLWFIMYLLTGVQCAPSHNKTVGPMAEKGESYKCQLSLGSILI